MRVQSSKEVVGRSKNGRKCPVWKNFHQNNKDEGNVVEGAGQGQGTGCDLVFQMSILDMGFPSCRCVSGPTDQLIL